MDTVGTIHYYDKEFLRRGFNVEKMRNGAGTGDQMGKSGTLKGSSLGGRGNAKGSYFDPQDMPILDARPILSEFSIDTHGFLAVRHQTKLTQSMETLFAEDEAEIRRVYWSEMEELCKRSVRLADGRLPTYAFALRTQKFSEEKERGFLASYSRQAHTDFADIIFTGAPKILTKRGVPEEEAGSMDLVIVNTWQPVMRAAYRDPLALLDWRTVEPGDFIEVRRDHEAKKAPDGKTFAYGCQLGHNPKHRWYYISNMSTEEVWLSKQADSRLDGQQSRYAFHTSFRDPKVDTSLPGRRSIAVNLICGFQRRVSAPAAGAKL